MGANWNQIVAWLHQRQCHAIRASTCVCRRFGVQILHLKRVSGGKHNPRRGRLVESWAAEIAEQDRAGSAPLSAGCSVLLGQEHNACLATKECRINHASFDETGAEAPGSAHPSTCSTDPPRTGHECTKTSTKPALTDSKARETKIDRRYAIISGAWSAAAVSLFNTWSALDENPNRHIAFYSPDHLKQIVVVGNTVKLRIGHHTFDTGINNVTNHDAELAWAPDSSKFFVTWSESGELGPWHMQVYRVDESGVHAVPNVEEPARKDFERRIRKMPIDPELNTPELRRLWEDEEYCEPYHVIGGRWRNGSKEILLSVLIRNTGDCRYMSEFNVYRVNALTGEMLQRFTAFEAHKRFGDQYLPKITRQPNTTTLLTGCGRGRSAYLMSPHMTVSAENP